MNEEEEVGSNNPHSRVRSESRSLTRFRNVFELQRAIQTHRQIHNELNDLEQGEILFPPDLEVPRGQQIVAVPDDVDLEVIQQQRLNDQIHEDGNPLDGSIIVLLDIGEQCGDYGRGRMDNSLAW